MSDMTLRQALEKVGIDVNQAFMDQYHNNVFVNHLATFLWHQAMELEELQAKYDDLEWRMDGLEK